MHDEKLAMEEFFFGRRPVAPDPPSFDAAPGEPVDPPPRYWLERVELDGVPQRVEDFRIEIVVDGPTTATVLCFRDRLWNGRSAVELVARVRGVKPGPLALELRTIFNRAWRDDECDPALIPTEIICGEDD